MEHGLLMLIKMTKRRNIIDAVQHDALRGLVPVSSLGENVRVRVMIVNQLFLLSSTAINPNSPTAEKSSGANTGGPIGML